MNSSDWHPVQLFCPNCGKKIMGFRNKDGVVKMQCDRCKCAVVSKKMTPRKHEITVELPLAETI